MRKDAAIGQLRPPLTGHERSGNPDLRSLDTLKSLQNHIFVFACGTAGPQLLRTCIRLLEVNDSRADVLELKRKTGAPVDAMIDIVTGVVGTSSAHDRNLSRRGKHLCKRLRVLEMEMNSRGAEHSWRIGREACADRTIECLHCIEIDLLPDITEFPVAQLQLFYSLLSGPLTPGGFLERGQMKRTETSGNRPPHKTRIVIHHEEVRLESRQRPAGSADIVHKARIKRAHPVDG